jgi:predicted TPR repeat methyltransferase
MAKDRARDRVERARRIKTPEEALDVYRDWACDYDRDVADELKFIGGSRIAELLAQDLAERTARIIDLGCGTGLVGEELKARGFSSLHGLDLSPEMLSVARQKALYRKTFRANMLQPLDFADGSYDAAVSAGTFTTGHVDATALPEVFRIIRPGGLLACVVADAVWQEGGFAAAFATRKQHTLHHSQEPITAGGTTAGHYLVVRVPGG